MKNLQNRIYTNPQYYAMYIALLIMIPVFFIGAALTFPHMVALLLVVIITGGVSYLLAYGYLTKTHHGQQWMVKVTTDYQRKIQLTTAANVEAEADQKSTKEPVSANNQSNQQRHSKKANQGQPVHRKKRTGKKKKKRSTDVTNDNIACELR